MNIYGEIATGIIETEFSYLTGAEIDSQFNAISGWLNGNIGTLNILIHTSLDEDSEWCEEEKDIFSALYMTSFYKKKVSDALRGIDSTVDWISISEGDSRITRTNKNEVAKTWRGLFKDSSDELKKLIDNYTIYESAPVDIIMIET